MSQQYEIVLPHFERREQGYNQRERVTAISCIDFINTHTHSNQTKGRSPSSRGYPDLGDSVGRKQKLQIHLSWENGVHQQVKHHEKNPGDV